MQRGERLVRVDVVCRVRSGVGPAPDRGRPAGRLHLCGPARASADAVRTMPAATARERRPGAADRDRDRGPAAARAAAGRVRARVSGGVMSFDAVDVIRAKRDKGELSDGQIDWVIDAYTKGDVADEQMSALAMAILLNGMNRREIARWTAAMIASGERMDFG